jgi:GTP-binding protein
MQIKEAKYETTAVKPEQYPKRYLPEVAWVGRSNVGKSSIINALLYRKSLARASATPGKTREINFYLVNEALYFVDLPGYGYARVSQAAKEAWGRMIETYLQTREQLQLIVMLVDIRHAPSKEDQVMYTWLAAQERPSLVVATKLDKIPRGQIPIRLRTIREALGMAAEAPVIPFSAVTGQGRDEIWRQIEGVIGL